MTAEERIAKLPEPIRKHVLTDDPYWCSIPKGWNELIVRMNTVLEAIDPNYVLKQAKEKFGGLRYACSVPDLTDEDRALFYTVKSHFEALSLRICEVCGQPGSPIPGGWIRTRCEEHNVGIEVDPYE